MPPRLNLNTVLRGPGDTSDVECQGAFIASGTAFGSNVQPATAPTLTNGATITPTAPVYRLSNGGAVTGILMAAGTYPGQRVTLINTTANSITFAAVGTSLVADGTSAVLAANTSMTLTYDSVGAKWYHGN